MVPLGLSLAGHPVRCACTYQNWRPGQLGSDGLVNVPITAEGLRGLLIRPRLRVGQHIDVVNTGAVNAAIEVGGRVTVGCGTEE